MGNNIILIILVIDIYRVRDEFRLTIHAAETLYESSIAFGNRQAVKAEQGRAERERLVMITRVPGVTWWVLGRMAEMLEDRCAKLRLEIEELNIAKDMLATRYGDDDLHDDFDETVNREEERAALAEKKHSEEVRFFTRTSQQLKAQLDGILATKDK